MMNTNNKNAPDYSARITTILRILEKDLTDNLLTDDEVNSLINKVKTFRHHLPPSELHVRDQITEMIITYTTRAYTDAAIAIGEYYE